MTLTGYEHKKMICSAELESYQKRPVLPLSVTNKLPIKTEHEKMSNLRNLFCIVALENWEKITKVKISFQNAVLVYFKIVRMFTFGSDSKIGSWTKSEFAMNFKHMLMKSCKNLFCEKRLPREYDN